MSTITAACDAVENLPVLGRCDAFALADRIIDDTIAALQRDPNISSRSFTEWELKLADLRARVAERLSLAVVGYVELETVLRELEFAAEYSDA
jgi:hypothetical protein